MGRPRRDAPTTATRDVSYIVGASLRGRPNFAAKHFLNMTTKLTAKSKTAKTPKIDLKGLKTRTQKIIQLLKRAYPDAKCSLNHSNAFELLIATILSAQCTDERVNIVTADLFRKYRKPEDYLKVPASELQDDIRTTGFFRNKTKSIQGTAKVLTEQYSGRVPETIEELLELPGVARKTANVVLGNAFGVASGVVVDTHVTRLSRRLGSDSTKGSSEDRKRPDMRLCLRGIG